MEKPSLRTPPASEVVDLARFLIACGARIEGHGTSVIRIQGVPRLGGCTYRIMPDRIEAGTLLAAAGITDGELLLTDCPFEELDAVIAKMRQMGMEIEPTADGVLARRSCLRQQWTATFPQLPDGHAVAQIMSLANDPATRRFRGHQRQAKPVRRRAGARPHGRGYPPFRAYSHHTRRPAPCRGSVMASDLRASASLVLAGLAAKGITTVQRIYHLDRGYEHIENKLNAVGARIRREAE